MSSELFSSPAKRAFVLGLLLMAVTLALYAPVAHNRFVNFDDDTYIINNAHVRAGLKWDTVKWSFTTFDQANWHPLTWLSHALDCEWFGLDAAGHHLVSAWLHALNVAILFWLLQSATGCTWRSLVVAALFGIHPVNVESVAWAAERKNVLSMLFFLLALLAYGWYARQPKLRRYGLVFLLFLLALMSKPQVITFPFLLLLLDYWPLRRMTTEPASGVAPERPAVPRFTFFVLVLEKLPLFLLSAASAVVTMMAQRAGHALRAASGYSLLNRVETALTSYVRYLRIAVWPSKLAVLYPHPTKLFPAWQVEAAVVVLLFVTAIVVWQWRQRPYLIVGWLWFLGSMFPMIGLVQVGGQALADRYAYIPFIGLFVMAVWTVADWAERRKIPTAWLAVAATVVMIALGLVTHRQIGFWRDTPTMWRRALEVTEDNFVAHTNLATFLEQQGQVEEAAEHVRAALAIQPDDPIATLSLGTYEHRHGNVPAAIERYKIVALHATDPDLRTAAYSNLGSAYRQVGDYADAKQCYERALQLSPRHSIAMVGLGLVALHEGDLAEAIAQFSNAMAVEPTDIGYLLLAHALEQAGHSTEAEAARQRAGLISPNLNEAQREADALMAGK
ncbi:MAG: tetratricopeptide repeat protein [Terriglobales bacterium]|jgi:tetratricopeptide (TPR) repeat protein